LEAASFCRPWSPGLLFLSFNISQRGPYTGDGSRPEHFIGDFNHTDPKRIEEFSLKHKRSLLPYDAEMHSHRAIYFPGYESNRLLTHFYSYLFFATAQEDHLAKRYMRDRLRYHDEIFCVGSRIIEKLLLLEGSPLETTAPQYIALHIRRGDFQQKHTRLSAEEIVNLTAPLVPDRLQRIAYIATDEGNRSFFAPFAAAYKAIYFLSDLQNDTGIETVNGNYMGMIEQVVCAGAHTFIGTPLSTFTAYITRMRGYLNRTISLTHRQTNESYIMDRRGVYSRTYYYMKHHMHMLHTKPHVNFPLWVRDFADVFDAIDD
jgi:hypothetical protein